ncbi:MFS transporter [Niastella yeongjuensis]|uniref:MFS transporter n=1 Tax=Niastella yeongjuensis TaxID=354355 RepID=A0A1V9EAG6_9BACT|nr:MFS transporter [Niastella yeongjuensis]OQP43127.1 MFS transporter [Niastella yeongjuensis]SEO67413.1 Predicted arabinose efflux permease, MFS family [Niastella yeongjuensis]
MNSTKPTKTPKPSFSGYEVFVIAILAFLQFTVILDFMVMSPLGAMLMPKLKISTHQFGNVVSGYAFSAFVSGILAAGFADKFDRKRLLIFFYIGFLMGTALCAMATDYHFLLIARIVTGLFGGVIGSVSMAIVTDLFRLEVRGRVMGFIQMAFAASQVLGLPIGLFLANHYGWHSPFWLIAIVGVIPGIIIALKMKPVADHLKIRTDHNPIVHMGNTISNRNYLLAFLTTTLLATGGYMLMPFGSAFSVNNLGITNEQLPVLYGISGIFTFVFGPLAGFLGDKLGKYSVFIGGTVLTMAMVAVYTNLGITPLGWVIVINVLMFAGIMARMSTSSALISAIPQAKDRGAFMSVNASVQQLAGGAAAMLAGMVINQGADGKIHHYSTLGIIVMSSMTVVMIMMYFINKQVVHKLAKKPTVAEKAEELAEAFVIE